ncbi:hypothetical protein MPDQ_007139 [Monascus purpureus]|uniref:SWR1-complex protein 3 domain-containing protein n=1 Tax=Monascus purpureus TaxID=5098 RepID=A0A507QV11_MONPU|nr:hypothetical protein MPDQ_007139 [Monascus purpureus]BDD58583.1 hypothetical protein MAP00_003849 [Monascus purpureus]
MGEKRRLSTRERREPAAKRRAAEATPQPHPPSRKKASTPVAPRAPSIPAPERIELPLPYKIKDGEGLPILPAPQPSDLSPDEYQSIAESAVLLASLERSKKKWLSDGILERYWTKPKKTKRELIEGKNPPKESMSKVGSCNIVIGPHIFDAMLYTVKDPNVQPQYTPPQRQMIHYGPHGNTFQQYQPYPPPQHMSPPAQHPHSYSTAHSAPRQPVSQPIPPPGAQPPTLTPHQHGNPHGYQPSTPQPAQRPSPSQPPQPSKPSPDPVIQMLATRAASNPELKALMRVVASSKASQEQLRTFQAHIDELNAIIRAREQQRQQSQMQGQVQPHARTPQASQQSPRQQTQPQHQQHQQQPVQQSQPTIQAVVPSNSTSPPQTPSQKQTTPQIKKDPEITQNTPNHPPLSHTPSETQHSPVPKPDMTPAVPSTPSPYPHTGQPSSAARPSPHPTHPQAAGPHPSPQYPVYQQPPQQIQSRTPQYGPPGPYYRPAAPPPPPPRINYKSVVFEFTSPLTPYGSSTSGHAGSGDRYLFPEYSILEWLPGGNAVIASFLLVRKVDPNAPFPLETAAEAASARGKGKSGSKSKKANKDKEKGTKKGKNNTTQSSPANQETPTPSSTPAQPKPTENVASQGSQTDKDKAATTATAPNPGSEDNVAKSEEAKVSEKEKDSNLKEYYQPVTIRIFTSNAKVLEPLSRVVKPPDQVRKYMNEVMDRAERAPEGFLALRLPREAKDDEKETASSNDNDKKAGMPTLSSGAHNAHSGRSSRISRQKALDAEADSGIENNVNVAGSAEEGGEEEELKDFYGPPTGLVPLRV